MNFITALFAICLALASIYCMALGVSILLNVDLVYGFIIPFILAILIGVIPRSSILQLLSYIFLLVSWGFGLISIFN